jgi:hypothetical protein
MDRIVYLPANPRFMRRKGDLKRKFKLLDLSGSCGASDRQETPENATVFPFYSSLITSNQLIIVKCYKK